MEENGKAPVSQARRQESLGESRKEILESEARPRDPMGKNMGRGLVPRVPNVDSVKLGQGLQWGAARIPPPSQAPEKESPKCS